MKLTIEQIISASSAIGVSTIISIIFTFFQTNKKNNLDFITKERAEWRNDMKSIIVDLLDGGNRRHVISRLKTQINPYGYNRNLKYGNDYYMNDGHIWDLLKNFTHKDEECEQLSRYLELLLKYDWERSKNEVRINNTHMWNILRWGLIVLNTIMFFWAGKVDNKVNIYLALVSVIFLLLQKTVISWLSTLNFDFLDSKKIFFYNFLIHIFISICIFSVSSNSCIKFL